MTSAPGQTATDDPEQRPHVLFQLSGSIAAYKACHAVSRLVQAGCVVQTVATASALNFVGPATLEGLTGRPVATDTFAHGSAMDHIHLVRWADVIVLCPATANTINRLAAGIGDDLIGTMFLAHDFTKPYVVVPAMNAAMCDHPATLTGLDRLRSWGVEVVEPSAGSLACGEIGAGRLAEPDVIVAEVLDRVRAGRAPGSPRWSATGTSSGAPNGDPTGRQRILVTAGGTKTPIDGVRAITNTSTGATGAAIVDHLVGQGHAVTLLHAADARLPDRADAAALHSFVTFGELESLLRMTLAAASFDAVIHVAAVGDYDVDHVEIDGCRVAPERGGKLDSGGAMSIHLRQNPKLLPQLKSFGGEQLTVVGFKLTNGASDAERSAAVVKASAGADFVVHNDAAERTADRHPATIYRGDEVVARTDTTAQLAVALATCLTARPRHPA